MNAYVLLAIVAGILTLIPVLWRSKGVYVFLLLSASLPLLSFAYPISLQIRSVFPGADEQTVIMVASLVLLFLAPVLAVVLTKKTVKKKILFHLVASVSAGLVGYIWLITHALPLNASEPFRSADISITLQAYVDEAIIAGVVSSLMLLWSDRPKPNEDDDKKKKGKKKH